MNDNIQYLLGKRFKELRKNKGYTQDKFSELLGIDPKHLSRIECGKTQPGLNLIKTAANIFDISLSKFFEIEHLENRENLILKINKIMQSAKDEQLRLIYKITKSITD